MATTTTELLRIIKRNVTTPANQIRFTNSDLLAMADEQMQVLILPLITSLRQEFYVVKTTTPIVASQQQYKIPYRAVGRTLRDIKVTSSTGSFSAYSIAYVNPEDTQLFTYNNSVGDIKYFTVRGDNIVLFPNPGNNNQILELYYELAPSKLVDTSEAGVVSSVDTGTGLVTLVGAITGFATGQKMDLIDGYSGNSVIGIDLVNTSVAANTVTFSPSDLPVAPNALKAGDYVALSNQSPVLQLPNECVMVLAQAVCCKILEAQGDFEGLQNSERKLQQNIEALEKIITPRVESQAPTILNTNGLAKNRLFRTRYYRYSL